MHRNYGAAKETELRILATTPMNRLILRYDRELLRVIDDSVIVVSPPANANSAEVDKAISEAAAAVSKWETPVDDLAKATSDLSSASYEVRRTQSLLQSLGAPALACQKVLLTGEPDRKEWEAANPELARKTTKFFNDLVNNCVDEKSAHGTLNTGGTRFRPSELKRAYTEWAEAQTQLEAAEQLVARRKSQYDQALKTYKEEAKRAEPGKPISDRVKQRAVAVAQALDAIQVVGGALGVEIASQERLNRLNDLIGSLKAGTEIDTETASKAEVVASMLPQIADKARAIGEADKGKALVPLLIQRDMEQAMLNAARVQVAVLRKRLALREAVVIARVKQADTLFNAHNWVRLVATCDRATFGDDEVSLCHKVRMGQPMHGMWGALPPKGRRTLLESITQYLDAYARQGADIDAMTTQELALAQERNLQLSEVNAAMWSTLIDATVRQSAEFSALGLKADDFEKLLNILGIFYIGHGVNK